MVSPPREAPEHGGRPLRGPGLAQRLAVQYDHRVSGQHSLPGPGYRIPLGTRQALHEGCWVLAGSWRLVHLGHPDLGFDSEVTEQG